MHELRGMPEYNLYINLQELNNSIYIFDRNFEELRKLLVFLTADERASELHWLENRDKLQALGMEVTRFLHNFVAAAKSLVDHTRRLYKKLYADNKKFPDYQNRVNKDFAHDPLSQFVQDLRRYFQHRKTPGLAFVSSLKSPTENLTRTIELPREEIEEFNDWSSLAKEYLNTIEGGVDILTVVTTYRNKVLKFYEWFQFRQREIHSVEIKRFRDKEANLLLLMLDEKIDGYLANPNRMNKEIEEVFLHIFLHIFSSKEFAELRNLPDNSVERASRAVQLLEEHFSIPDELSDKIFRLYSIPK
jgi:hypothetical protein